MSLKGKELLFSALRHEPLTTLPWVPFAGVHAGFLAGFKADEVYTDADKLYTALLRVHDLYKPDGMPVIFDLQVEAEILGCELQWSEEAPPAVKTHCLAETEQIPTKLPEATDGRLPLILSVMESLTKAIGERTALYGLLCGPFTLAAHLRGTNLFMDMVLDEDYVHRLLDYTTAVAVRMADLYLSVGMDVIAAVDPLVSQISPEHFRSFLKEPYSRLFTHIRQAGVKREVYSSFFVCGNATNKIEPMCETAPDCISIDENVDMATAKAVTDRYNITLQGNIPLTTVMLFGSQQDNMKYVVDLHDALDHRNLVIAPGCDLPYTTPLENVVAVEQAVHQTAVVREMIKNYNSPELEFHGELPDYEHLEKPLVEVFTLDSDTCAACTYMKAAALDGKAHFGDAIEMVEYKYTVPENIARMRKMGVEKLPSIYINGKLKFSSIIPSKKALIEEVEACLR
ncbi:MAG TPA: uroporphyrinogen decarboxylase [Firmicutes bacterium]|nr:uroporphyrinogen decarboxylase [Bacillota bacterium]